MKVRCYSGGGPDERSGDVGFAPVAAI